DQEEALTMSCRVAVMAQGKVMQVATPRELYETPNSRAVASFIGTMNFFEATTKGIEGERLLLDAQGLGGIAAPVPGWQVNGKAVVAIRPEKLQLSLDRPQGEVSAAQGTILNSTYLGDRSHFHVRLDGVEAPIAVSAQNVERSMRDDLDDGTPVWLSWRDTAMVVLPG
ncbi:MAG: TOBE domain-containing protein, partial [Alphaproteobacteria bacterium]|nr:TOBE domain-containing protein [Alphaproteobacteria bacterium]